MRPIANPIGPRNDADTLLTGEPIARLGDLLATHLRRAAEAAAGGFSNGDPMPLSILGGRRSCAARLAR